MDLTVGILAGGMSSRMGYDKALARVGGVTMLERAVRLARGVSERVIVLGRDGPSEGGVEFLRDQQKWAGPMPALVGLIGDAGGPVLLLACDMPLLRAETVGQLVLAHEAGVREGACAATMAVTRDDAGRVRAEPALAVYEMAAIPVLQRLIVEAKGSFQPLLRERGVGRWEVPADAVGELLNVNTPEDVARAEALLGARGV